MPTGVLRLIAPCPNFAQTMTDAEREIMTHEETLSSGDAVRVPAAAPHQLRNDSADALEFLVISSSPT